MKRSQFLKNLIGLCAVSKIPFTSFARYEKVYLKECFVRGFSYYAGPQIIDEINKSGMVELVREPENPHDDRAIAIHFNGRKVGYLPRESNKTLSILMDTALLEFHAEITHVEPDADDWEKIAICVYALKEIKDDRDYQAILPYSVLSTPTYYTLKTEQEIIRVNPGSEFEPEEDEKHFAAYIQMSEVDGEPIFVLVHNCESIDAALSLNPESGNIAQFPSLLIDAELSHISHRLTWLMKKYSILSDAFFELNLNERKRHSVFMDLKLEVSPSGLEHWKFVFEEIGVVWS